MELTARIAAHFEQSGQLKLDLAGLLATPIAKSAEIIVEALLNEKKNLAVAMVVPQPVLNTLPR